MCRCPTEVSAGRTRSWRRARCGPLHESCMHATNHSGPLRREPYSGVNGLPDGRQSSCPMRYPSCSDTLWGLASQIFTFSSRCLRRLVGAGQTSAGAGCSISTARQTADRPKINLGAASGTEAAGCALAAELGRHARIRNLSCAAAPSLGALAACALQASGLRARARSTPACFGSAASCADVRGRSRTLACVRLAARPAARRCSCSQSVC